MSWNTMGRVDWRPGMPLDSPNVRLPDWRFTHYTSEDLRAFVRAATHFLRWHVVPAELDDEYVATIASLLSIARGNLNGRLEQDTNHVTASIGSAPRTARYKSAWTSSDRFRAPARSTVPRDVREPPLFAYAPHSGILPFSQYPSPDYILLDRLMQARHFDELEEEMRSEQRFSKYGEFPHGTRQDDEGEQRRRRFDSDDDWSRYNMKQSGSDQEAESAHRSGRTKPRRRYRSSGTRASSDSDVPLYSRSYSMSDFSQHSSTGYHSKHRDGHGSDPRAHRPRRDKSAERRPKQTTRAQSSKSDPDSDRHSFAQNHSRSRRSKGKERYHSPPPPSSSSSSSSSSTSRPFNPYTVLSIPSTASLSTIKKAYTRLALQHHPDKQGGKSPKEVRRATRRMADIDRAREILSDKWRRAAWDADGIVEESEFQMWKAEQM